MIDVGLEIEAIWSDEHLLELRIYGSNGGFAGETNLYVGFDEIPNMVKQMRGFPYRSGDSLVFDLGSFSPEYAGGGVRLIFQCNNTGRISVETRIENDLIKSTGRYDGKVQFTFWTEPSAIDLFIPSLENIGINWKGKAILRGLTTG